MPIRRPALGSGALCQNGGMTDLARKDGGRRRLQATLGVLGAIPFASGLAGMLVGPTALPGDDSKVGASLDSEYRFVNAFWFAAGPAIWTLLPRIERESTAFRLVGAATFVGGLARLISWRKTSRPHPNFVAAIGIELIGMPAFLAWQRHVSKMASINGKAAVTANS